MAYCISGLASLRPDILKKPVAPHVRALSCANAAQLGCRPRYEPGRQVRAMLAFEDHARLDRSNGYNCDVCVL